MFETNDATAPGARTDESTSPRDRRHAETRQEIIAAAWDLARRDGLVGIALRGLGERVGLKASSLYAYFDSKGALYDAMYRQAYLELLERSEEWALDADAQADPHAALAGASREFFRLCLDDPVRYQLLFQRTVPDWTPSEDSYALALAYLDRLRTALAEVGITDERAIDMWTAMMTGLTSQQLSNDPGGDRWFRLVDDAVAMFLHRFPPTTAPASRTAASRAAGQGANRSANTSSEPKEN